MQYTLTMAQVTTIKNADAASVAESAATVLITPAGNFNESSNDVVVAYLTEDGTNLSTVTVFTDGSVAQGWMA